MTQDRGYRDLIAWQKAMVLVRQVYLVSDSWPQNEQLGLTNQTRKSAVSVPSNIAEGKGRTGSREFAHHLSMAHGSLCELETQLQIAHDLGYMPTDRLQMVLDNAEEVGRAVRGLIRKLNA